MMLTESKQMDQNTSGSYRTQLNPKISGVTFNRENIQYSGGDQLRAHYIVEGIDPQSISAVERSVVWYTEGKGEEDLVLFSLNEFNSSSEKMAAKHRQCH